MKRPMLIVFTAVLLWSCARAASPTWTSVPAVQEISTPAYTIQAEPKKGGNPFYVAFLLTIQNHGNRPLEVDWNNTHYIHGGKDLGVFVFRGIDPGRIKGAIPPDIIPAGEIFAKEIFPLRTIAFLPRRETPEPGRLGFEPGILPGGENTIRLSLRRDDRQWQENVTLRLMQNSAKP